MANNAPAFDPTKPFDVVAQPQAAAPAPSAAPEFDPAQPFDTVDAPAQQPGATFIGPNIPAVSQGRLRGQNSQPVIPPGTDTQTGAPGNVRMLVGSAPPRDRLANLQKYYPDAIAVPDRNGNPTDNFIFTDPQSGKKTLYNPQGLDLGDVSSVGREAAQGVGATVGGGVGALEALPTGELAAPVTVPIMAGIGATTADNMYSALMQSFGGQVDTRSPVEHGLDDAFLAGTTALGNTAGDMIGTVGRATTKPLFAGALLGPEGTQRIANMEAAGVTPTLATASTRSVVPKTTAALNAFPTSTGVVSDAAARNVGEVEQGVDRLATQFSGGQPTTSPQVAGGALQTGAASAAERFQARQDQLYDAAFNRIGADTPVPLNNVRQLYAQIASQTAGAHDALSGTVSGMNRIADVMRASIDPVTGRSRPVSFETLRRIRTEIGRELNDPVVAGSTGATNDVKRMLSGALTADLNAVAAQDPAARQLLQQADRYTRFNMNHNIPVLQKLQDAGTPEQVYNIALAGAKDGGTTLTRIRRNLQPEEWDVMAGTVLGRLGQAPASKQNANSDVFSVNTFLTNWSDKRLSPEAKTALFGGTRYGDLRTQLDRLAQAAEYVKGVDQYANPSGTARNYMFVQAIASLGGILAHPTAGTVATASGAAVVPWAAAKLVTNPAFVRALVSTTRMAPDLIGPGQHGAIGVLAGLPAYIGRLTAIAKANPDISEPIGQYIQALQQNTGQAQQTTPPSASQ